jgi:hypothetical protein
MTLALNLAFGVNDTDQFTTITRTDGKPLRIVRLDASRPWITAKVEPGAKADDATTRTNFLRAWKLLPTGAKSAMG